MEFKVGLCDKVHRIRGRKWFQKVKRIQTVL